MQSFFSKNFKYLRKQKNISQTELADALGISRSKIASYEGRGVEPKLKLLVDIARYFDVSIEDLIGKDIEQTINESGRSAVNSFKNQSKSKTDMSDSSSALYLNIDASENLDKFLKDSATVIKMLEGFKVFYKIKTETIPLSEMTEDVKKAHHDIQNVMFLIDYLLEHNKNLITVLNNAEAA